MRFFPMTFVRSKFNQSYVILTVMAILQAFAICSLFGQEPAPAVVLLQNEHGLCSGVCVDAQGVILTARHCKHGNTVLVTWPDGRTETAKRIYTGPGVFDGVAAYDLPGDNWPHMKISAKPPVAGDTVWLCGYPQGEWQSWKASVIGESRHITLERYTIVNKSTQPGWSGGPLVNEAGQVVGLLSHTDAGFQGNSYFLDLKRVQKAYTQACRDGFCRPPSRVIPQPELSPEPPPGEQVEPEVNFDGVVIVLVTPELLEGTAGVAADIVGGSAFGVPRRLVRQVSGGKADFVGISQRVDPAKFDAVTQSLELPSTRPSLVAFIPKTNQGLLKGLAVKKIENEIVSRLEGVLFAPIFERVSGDDYITGLEVVKREYGPLAYEPDSETILDRARAAAIDEIKSRLPDQSEIVNGVAESLKDRLPEQAQEKATKALEWWQVYQSGGLGLLIITILGSRVHSHMQSKKSREIISTILKKGPEKSQPSSQS